MEYKVLVKLYVPEIEQSYDMYIPVNKTVSHVILLLNRAINSESSEIYPLKNSLRLINKRTYTIYKFEDIIRNTDIRNGTQLVLI